MAVNDVTRLALIHSLTGADGDIIVTHHFRQTSAAGGFSRVEEVSRLLDSWQTNAQSEYRTALSNRVVLQSIQARSLTDPTIGVDRSIGLAGTRDPAGLGNVPLRSAPVVSLRTGLIGRSFRGRNFLPPPNENDIVNGILSAGVIADIGDYYTQALELTDGLIPNPNVWRMTIYSPTLTGPTGPILDNPVQTFLVRSIVGSQRGRQRVA